MHTNFNLRDQKERLVRECVAYADGNVSLAAELLGITRQTLYSLLQTYGILLPTRSRFRVGSVSVTEEKARASTRA